MSANRLFQIINILLKRKTVTATELARKFEVSVRTIYRDIDTLSLAGVPIYATPGRSGGISLLENYVLDKSLLSSIEQEHILTALKNTSAVSNEVDDLIIKLSALFQIKDTDWMEVDLSRWGNRAGDKEKFQILKDAIITRHLLTFCYISSYGERSTRTVKPVKLIFKSKGWYLQAFCLDKNAYRIFKINRISHMELQKEHFEEVLAPPQIEEEIPIGQYPLLKLKFNKGMAYRVYEEFDDNDITLDNENDLLVSVRLPEDKWLYGFLLSFGAQLKVLEPAHMKAVLVEEAKKIFDTNK